MDFKLSEAILKYFRLGDDDSKTKKILLLDIIKNYKVKIQELERNLNLNNLSKIETDKTHLINPIMTQRSN